MTVSLRPSDAAYFVRAQAAAGVGEGEVFERLGKTGDDIPVFGFGEEP